jgi:hypothetical protein
MHLPSTALALVLAALPALAEDRPAPPEGFTPLFDGATLEGWKPVNTRDNFLVKDGVLVMDRGRGWLATETPYADFDLRIRYRFVTPGADSGIFIRSDLEGKNWTSRGYQIQNMDNQTLGTVVSMGRPVRQKEHRPDRVRELKRPAGEWMVLTIEARGPSVRVLLDGQEIASGQIEPTSGHIGLQAEGGVLEFERIDIRPHPGDAARGREPGDPAESGRGRLGPGRDGRGR